LDDPASQYIQAFKDTKVLDTFNEQDSSFTETKLRSDRLAEAPLVFQPGERYLYGLSMDVLGRVIEVVSGNSLKEYFNKNIFEPLGMNDTYFYLPKEKHGRLVPVYSLSEKDTYTMAETDDLISNLNYPCKKIINTMVEEEAFPQRLWTMPFLLRHWQMMVFITVTGY